MKRFAAMLIALVMMLTMVPAMAETATGTGLRNGCETSESIAGDGRETNGLSCVSENHIYSACRCNPGVG